MFFSFFITILILNSIKKKIPENLGSIKYLSTHETVSISVNPIINDRNKVSTKYF
tara:strand:+ start:950 stop:1114 length:165 start_codon:yes stop_codon:yes gene_type:complete